MLLLVQLLLLLHFLRVLMVLHTRQLFSHSFTVCDSNFHLRRKFLDFDLCDSCEDGVVGDFQGGVVNCFPILQTTS